jgi:DNA-binding YbaB/EbfC family protein
MSKLGDLTNLLKNAGKIKEAMARTQEELANTNIVGEAGAGMVKVTLNGRYYMQHVELSDEVMQESKEVISDLITAATNDAVAKVEKLMQDKMMSASGMMGGDMSDLL